MLDGWKSSVLHNLFQRIWGNLESMIWCDVPVHMHRASVSVLQDLPGRSGRSRTVGFDPVDTENTERIHPEQDL